MEPIEFHRLIALENWISFDRFCFEWLDDWHRQSVLKQVWSLSHLKWVDCDWFTTSFTFHYKGFCGGEWKAIDGVVDESQ